MADEKKLSDLAYAHIYGTKMLPDSQYPLTKRTPLNGVPAKPAEADRWFEWEWRNKPNKGIS